jgi:serine/threonine protein kinase
MLASPDCPGIETWQTVLRAALAPDERKRWEGHLEACPACREQLDRMTGGPDDLVRLARQVGDPTAAPRDTALGQVVKQLLAEKPAGRPAAPRPVDLSFLLPADRPGVLGLLGPYEVEEVLGQGGMGVVLKAFEPALHRHVAIKVLATQLAASPIARRRFAREGQAVAAVCHEHVVAVHGVREVDGLPCLVMEYVAGESLQHRLDRAGPLDVAEVVRIGYETAAGLAAAHAQGLIHRDIKPANLLLEGEPGALATGGRTGGRVKITDFGLARAVDDVSLTQQGVVAGTPEYMAPEQARAEPVDHRVDLFSLGSVLYALCAGRPPFRGPTALAVLRQVSDEPPTPLRELDPEVPAWLEQLIARLLAKDPADRIQSAAEAATLLERFLAHLDRPATVPVPPPPGPPVGRRPEPPSRAPFAGERRRPPWWTVLALLAAGGLAAGALVSALTWGGGSPLQAPAANDPAARPGPAEDAVDEQVWTLAFSPDGTRLVTGGGNHTLPGQLQIWDVAAGKPLVSRRALPGVRAVACSPDGQVLATGHWEGEIKLRDPQTGTEWATLSGHERGANALAFSADSALLASAGLDATVRLWDVKARRERRQFLGHDGMVFSVAFFRHGRALLTGGNDGTARIWDLETGKEPLVLRGHARPVETVAVSPDDTVVATGSWDGTVKLWDADSGREVAALRASPNWVLAVAFSPDGRLLAVAGSGGFVHIWDVASRQRLSSVQQHGAFARALAFSPDGKLLASGGEDRTIQLWDVAAARNVATLSAVGAPLSPDAPGGSSPRTGSRAWLTTAVLTALALALSLAGVWLSTRWRHRAAKAPAAAPVPRPEAHGPRKGGARGFGGPRRLATLLVLALAGAGVTAWLAEGGAQTERKPVVFHQDFRALDPDSEALLPDIQGGQRDDQGVRIVLPAHQGKLPRTGYRTNFATRGDFEATFSFDIMKADQPDTGYGVGVSIYAQLDPKTNDAASLARRVLPDGRVLFLADRMIPSNGRLTHHVQTLPAAAAAGRLCLRRVGRVLRYLVADGADADLVPLTEFDFGPDDVRPITVGGDAGGSESGLDARLVDLTIRADELPGAPAVGAAGPGGEPVAPGPFRQAQGKGWLLAAGLVGLGMLVTALAWWARLHLRQRRPAGEATASAPLPVAEAQPETEGPAISFRCSGCGRGLRARAGLAGKKLRCPHCGQAVVVPGIQTGAPGGTSE